MQGECFGGSVDRRGDQRARKTDAIWPTFRGPHGQQVLLQPFWNIADAQIFKQAQRGVIYLLDLGLGERCVEAAPLTGRTRVRRRSGSPARQTGAPPAALWSLLSQSFVPCRSTGRSDNSPITRIGQEKTPRAYQHAGFFYPRSRPVILSNKRRSDHWPGLVRFPKGLRSWRSPRRSWPAGTSIRSHSLPR